MTLTCTCGARFEPQESRTEQDILCPECRQPVRVSAESTAAPVRTSDWALASVILALTGAFTVVGTLAAVVCGGVAVLRILRQRERLAGLGLAVTGMVAGAVFTALTLFALSRAELFGLGGRLRANLVADQIDTTGPDKIVAKDTSFEIVRPTKQWGVARAAPKKEEEDATAPGRRSGDEPPPRPEARLRLGDATAEALVSSGHTELLLVEPMLSAFVDVARDHNSTGPNERLERYQLVVRDELHALLEVEAPRRSRDPHILKETRLPAHGEVKEARELLLTLPFSQQSWRMLIRLYRTSDNRVFIVRAYAREKNFDAVEPELRKALDSFRIR